MMPRLRGIMFFLIEAFEFVFLLCIPLCAAE
jgi:hypothetical protein